MTTKSRRREMPANQVLIPFEAERPPEVRPAESPLARELRDAAVSLQEAVNDFVDKDNGGRGTLSDFVIRSREAGRAVAIIKRIAGADNRLSELARQAKSLGRHDLLRRYLGDALSVLEEKEKQSA